MLEFTFAIAHRLSTVLNADQILVLEAGRVVGRGTHTQLLEMDGSYARLYAAQFQNETFVAAGEGLSLNTETEKPILRG